MPPSTLATHAHATPLTTCCLIILAASANGGLATYIFVPSLFLAPSVDRDPSAQTASSLLRTGQSIHASASQAHVLPDDGAWMPCQDTASRCAEWARCATRGGMRFSHAHAALTTHAPTFLAHCRILYVQHVSASSLAMHPSHTHPRHVLALYPQGGRVQAQRALHEPRVHGLVRPVRRLRSTSRRADGCGADDAFCA